jgi:hypothetical protein
MNGAARFISYLFHPLWMPLVGVWVIMTHYPEISFVKLPSRLVYFIGGVVSVFTILMPLITLLLMRAFRLAESVMLYRRKERILPMSLSVVYYFVSYFFLKNLDIIPEPVIDLSLAAVVVVLFSLFITLYWQISLHLFSLGTLLGFFTAISFTYGVNFSGYIYLTAAVSGITAFARLELNAHTPSEVYAGFLTGFALAFPLLSILLFW